MTKEEVEYEILKIFASKINFEFESYQDLWTDYNKTLHCTQNTFNEILREFESADYIGISINGHFTPTKKSKTAYINHHIGRHQESVKNKKEADKLNAELSALQFSNSKWFKTITILGMIVGIIGGGFGIASYYKKNPEHITLEELKIYVDSVRQVDESKYLDHETMINYIDSINIDFQEINISDTTINND